MSSDGPVRDPWKAAAEAAAVLTFPLTVLSAVHNGDVTWTVLALSTAVVAAVAFVFYLVRTRRKQVSIPQWTVVLVLAALIGAVVFSGWSAVRSAPPWAEPRPAPTDPKHLPPTEGPTPGGQVPTAAGGCTKQRTTAVVEPDRDDTTTGARLTAASYTMQPGEQILIQWTGTVRGPVEKGSALWLVGNADDTTVDSTPGHHRGSPYYFFMYELKPDANGCWTTPLRPVGYPCAGGLTFIYHLISVDAALGRMLYRQEHASLDLEENGYARDRFESLPLKKLQEFRVDTSAARCNPPH